MANVKQIKQKTTGTLLDVEDTQARADIASEVVNRTNADNALQEKINTNKNDISELKGDLDNISGFNLKSFADSHEKIPVPHSIVVDYKGGNYNYKYFTVDLTAGTYTILINEMKNTSVGYFNITKNAPNGALIKKITKSGLYIFSISEDTTVCFNLQVSLGTAMESGTYYVKGISLYNGDYIDYYDIALVKDVQKVTAKKLDKIHSKNLFNPNDIDCMDDYYINYGGNATHNQYASAYFVSGYIPVEQGETYAFNQSGNIGNTNVAFYNSTKEKIIVYTYTQVSEMGGVFIAPEGARYFRFTAFISNKGVTQFEKGSVSTDYVEYTEYLPLYNVEKAVETHTEEIEALKVEKVGKIYIPEIEESTSMTTGDSLTIEASNSKANNTISFMCNVTEMGKITISCGKRVGWGGAWVEIDDTNIIDYSYLNQDNLISTTPHGLSISDMLSITIKVLDNKTADVIISTPSNSFKTNIKWTGGRGNIMVETESGTYTDCTFSFYVADYLKDVWAYGDSYFDMWVWLLKDYGYNNLMIDGFSGRGSSSALSSLKKALTYATPKKILWCMGMNDADSNTSVSTSWKTAYDELVRICDTNNIELILTTIPNVPERSHSFKNEIVRASGKRYVDIDKAVGAYENSAWYDGLLSGDNVHPTTRGQHIIASAIMASVPEIMVSL